MENQRPMLPFLADALAALMGVGHVTLGESDPELRGMRPVLVTASGRARYEDLCDRQGVPPYPSRRDRPDDRPMTGNEGVSPVGNLCRRRPAGTSIHDVR